VAEMRKTVLEVHGHGVVDLGADAVLVEVRLEFVTSRAADDALVVDGTRFQVTGFRFQRGSRFQVTGFRFQRGGNWGLCLTPDT
jgi:hypothetical protein